MADIADPSIASWVQTGGVVAFAAAVLLQLRELKPLLTMISQTMSALLERERVRGERLAAQDAERQRLQIARAMTPAGGIVAETWDDDATSRVAVPLPSSTRAQTSPGAYGPGRPPRGGG